MPFKAQHASFVSFAVEVMPSGTAQVMVVETDLHLNPRHSSYHHPAVEKLVAAAKTYVRDNLEGLVHIRLVSTRSGEL
jgi:hypothetical protein